MRNFLRNKCGASAVEFAIIAPVLAVALLGIAEVGQVIYQRTDMHGALRTGGQYVLNGGRDLDVVEELVLRSWNSRPEDAVVEASRYCLCGEIEHACNSPCVNSSIPEAYIMLQAHATLGGIVVEYGEDADDAIRIR